MKNLAELTLEEKDKINVDLSASGVAYKERQQPAHLRVYFNERLAFYRKRIMNIKLIFTIMYIYIMVK
ncbi:DNA polymerase III subunit theta [Proteus appendicitidis]|uniref:DNA polymerase III subunit theta n=1 Tax=Proteus appendicitidis TaxID=3034648 RepID=A0ABY8YDV1_9GAMM|nr:DNA polymerase III subunit theta [Proteus sp. HZ0627]WIV90262.1 DNA polymerase III subunit theta [Proteus sp. HZ0627]